MPRLTRVATRVPRGFGRAGFLFASPNSKAKVMHSPEGSESVAAYARAQERAEAAAAILAARRIRTRHFDNQLFGEQGWELLLHLYTEARSRNTVASVGVRLGLSLQTTAALARLLSNAGLVAQDDSTDGWDQIPLTLTEEGRAKMASYLDDFGSVLKAA